MIGLVRFGAAGAIGVELQKDELFGPGAEQESKKYPCRYHGTVERSREASECAGGMLKDMSAERQSKWWARPPSSAETSFQIVVSGLGVCYLGLVLPNSAYPFASYAGWAQVSRLLCTANLGL